MKNVSSKILSLLLVLVMVVSLCACVQEPVNTEPTGNKGTNPSNPGTDGTTPTEEDLYYNKTGYPICDEPITIKVSGIQGNTLDWNNTAFVKYVKEHLGIILECEPFAKDAASSMYAGYLSTETQPDILAGMALDKAQVNLDGADGYWLDLSEYMDLMPNFAKMLEDYPAFNNYTKDSEGHIYSVNRVAPGIHTNSRGQINYVKEWVEAVYPGEIKTVDDLYNALKAVKAAYPDKTPLALTFDAAPAYVGDIILRSAFGVHFYDNSYQLIEDANGNVTLGELTENNRAYMQFLNKLCDEGLLSKEAMTMSKNEYLAEVKAGKFVFYGTTGMGGVDLLNEDGTPKYPDNKQDMNEYGVIYALTSDYNKESTYVLNSGLTTNARIMVSANTEYPEAICRFIDWLCSEEGRMVSMYGVEGEHYDLVTDDYGVWTTNIDNYWDKENFETAGNWQQQTVVVYQGFNMWWNFAAEQLDHLDVATLQKLASDRLSGNQPAALRILGITACDKVITAPAPLVYTAEEAEARKTLAADLTSYLKAQKVAFITGTADPNSDADWNAFVNQVHTMGWDVLQPIEQAAWDRING